MAEIEAGIHPMQAPTPGMSSAGNLRETFRAPISDRFMFRDLDWSAYRKIADTLGEHHHYHLSYDGRDLEIMTKSKGHGKFGQFVSYMIQILTEELGLPLESCGDMTCEREDIERGIEPDGCFYIQNEPRVRGKEKVDLAFDPPPDLGLEIDLTTDSRRRMGIYGAIGIPEIWRYDGRSQTISIYVLQSDGSYSEVDRSQCLSLVSAADITMFLERLSTDEGNSVLKAFREWVRNKHEESR